MLGGALLGQRKYTEAEPLLISGYDGMKQRENKISKQITYLFPESMERLVQLYEAQSQNNKAVEWQKKLDAYRESEMKTAKPKTK
jgi:hypothetical protein